MLRCKRDTDNGNEHQQPKNQVSDCYAKTSGEKPDHVHDHSQAARVTFGGNHFLPERTEGEYADFKALKAKRDAYDGETEGNATDHVAEKQEDASPKNNPEQISDDVHKVGCIEIKRGTISSCHQPGN